MLAGCISPFPTRTPYPDAKKDQPWAGHAFRAQGTVINEVRNVTGARWLVWTKPNGRKMDSRKVTKKCEKFLRKQKAWESLGFRMANKGTSDKYISHIYKRLVIVCVDPIIVAIGPGKTNYYGYTMNSYPETLSTIRKGPDGNLVTESGLTRGFVYGTRVPYTSDVQWFSPDLKVGPISAERISETEQHVSVRWGTLVFTHENDEWVVTTRE